MATKYFVVTSSLDHTNQKWTHNSESFSTLDQARTRHHKFLSDHYSSANTECANSIVKNEHGSIFDNDYLEKHFEAPEE